MSSLTDAVTQSIIAGMPNSETAMMREYLADQRSAQKLERIARKSEIVDMLEAKLARLNENGTPNPATVQAYEKMLSEAHGC